MANIADWTRLYRRRLSYDKHNAVNADLQTGRFQAESALTAEQFDDDTKSTFGFNTDFDAGVVNEWHRKLDEKRIAKLFNNRKDYVSFSGTDIEASIWFPILGEGGVYPINTLQTLTVSTYRDLIPGRTLGRAAAKGYCRGTRSVAGTCIMVLAETDPFSMFLPAIEINRQKPSSDELPFYLDRIPPFWLVLSGVSEIPDNDVVKSEDPTTESAFAGSLALQNVHLFSTSGTFSVNDIYTETTYQYMAEDYIPFTSKDVSDTIKDIKATIKLQRDNETNSVRDKIVKHYQAQKMGLDANGKTRFSAKLRADEEAMAEYNRRPPDPNEDVLDVYHSLPGENRLDSVPRR